MVSHSRREVFTHLRRVVAPRELPSTSDGDLLQRFARLRDEAAFTELLRRHGPMVLRVGQRLLSERQDAEDVFQATFLTLARKAGSIRKGASVAYWLHGVARFLALRLRRSSARRQAREANASTRATTDPLHEVNVREAQALLDEELARLPERLRAPLVACYLEVARRVKRALAARGSARVGWSASLDRGCEFKARTRSPSTSP